MLIHDNEIEATPAIKQFATSYIIADENDRKLLDASAVKIVRHKGLEKYLG